ncbi:hypothetical protein AAFF_G00114180 [Aldrovandia affinis]|uniref:Uncharacterized protein n=1 Tax=Aldrovandia affinis TaxID=143900 RepID=A0AAD7WAA5_9TELE|nr:hypothetical protein AAFF_G00114180 [Aldrovandia affinis]
MPRTAPVRHRRLSIAMVSVTPFPRTPRGGSHQGPGLIEIEGLSPISRVRAVAGSVTAQVHSCQTHCHHRRPPWRREGNGARSTGVHTEPPHSGT